MAKPKRHRHEMERNTMRQIREILRLRLECKLTERQVVASTGVSKGSVFSYTQRAKKAGLDWSVAKDMDDAALEARLFTAIGRSEPRQRVPIHQAWVHRELRRTGVTLYQLWLEYCEAANAETSVAMRPCGYSQFCDRYASYRERVDVTMRQVHRGGEKCFVDYSGKRLRIHDRESGEAVYVELFIGVLGASNFTFAECTLSQTLPDFCGSTVRMFEYFGGTPKIMVPDQLRSAVSGPDRYDPESNPTYAELAQHYEVAIVPARAGEPRDKAKVEGAVLIAQRWSVACLRNITFFRLSDLNAAVAVLLERLNNQPFRKLEGNRRTAFEAFDRPLLPYVQVHGGAQTGRIPQTVFGSDPHNAIHVREQGLGRPAFESLDLFARLVINQQVVSALVCCPNPSLRILHQRRREGHRINHRYAIRGEPPDTFSMRDPKALVACHQQGSDLTIG